MKFGNYILDSLREKFESDEEFDGFDDLRYAIGNSSGFDIGQSPSPMDQRIGHQAQRAGSVQEISVSNPGTFQIEKEAIYNTVNQLGIDISIHSDASTGFTSAYRTRSQAVGYDIAHDYFKRYLEQVAVFKKEKEERGLDFEIQRINPHISTSAIPPLSERMAQDVGVDPFGFELGALDTEGMNARDSEDQNIFRNKKFIERFYHTFILKRAEDEKWRFFAETLSRNSQKFDRIFRDAQRQACDYFFREGVKRQVEKTKGDKNYDRLQTKIALVSTAARSDVGVEKEWLPLIEKEFEDGPIELDEDEYGIEKLSSPEDVDDILKGQTRVTRLTMLSEVAHKIYNGDFSVTQPMQGNIELDIPDKKKEEIRDKMFNALENRLQRLWDGETGNGDADKFLISVKGKRQALSNHLDVEIQHVLKYAASLGEVEDPETGEEFDLDEAAVEMLQGEEDFFRTEEEEERDPYLDLMSFIAKKYEREMWKESSIFYFILPAWMAVSDNEYDGHAPRKAPKFLWEATVKRRWDGDYDLDLTDPGKENGYFEALEKTEFRMDVAAAVGSLYAWGHFTQRESEFRIEREKYVDDTEVRTTWIDWMNRFGIGVNMESFVMQRDEYYKVWRPKDIVAACHAINMTARDNLDSIHPDLDERPAKFTIDLEHTASFGIDPMKEMDILIEQEKELAEGFDEYNIDIDPDKPLAKILREWHLVKPGLETKQGESLHGPWMRGDTDLYESLYRMVDAGFARNPEEVAYLMYEIGGEQAETTYMARIAMDLIELGVTPEELSPSNVPADGNYDNEKQALMARFFGMDKASINQEWAKIEEHAFDPLKGLLEAEEFDYTWSGRAATDNENRPAEWQQEEYK